MKKNDMLLFWIVLIFAFLLRFWGVWFDLPEIYTTEEYKVVNYALRMGARKSLNPEFFNYPSLYLYFTLFISGLYFIIGKLLGIFSSIKDFGNYVFTNPTGLYVIMRTFSAIWSTWSVAITYFIGKQLFNKRIGLLAMLMLTLNPSILVSSHEIRPGMPSIFFVLCATLFVIKYFKENKVKFLYYASIFLGIATSIFYNAGPMILFLLIIFVIKDKNIFDKKIFFVLVLFMLFFVLGTPYSVLNFNTFLKDFVFHSSGSAKYLLRGILPLFKDLLFIGNRELMVPFLGIISLFGLIHLFLENNIKKYLVIIPIIIYFFFGSMYHVPSLGYVFPIVVFLYLAGAKFIDYVMERHKRIWSLIIILMLPSYYDCFIINYRYSIKDIRTIAKEWIEKNIPYGSKILVDMYPHSPPIKETKGQLEKLYLKAQQIDHYKKEYIKMQLDTHPGNEYGYEIYRILRPAEEISGTIDMVKEAQKVQDLIDVEGGLEIVKKYGINYIIFNSYDIEFVRNSKNEVLKNFYREVEQNCVLIKQFPETKNKIQKGPDVYIYKLI